MGMGIGWLKFNQENIVLYFMKIHLKTTEFYQFSKCKVNRRKLFVNSKNIIES